MDQLASIDLFIPSLPKEYQALAYMIRMTAIEPEAAIALEVREIETLWRKCGFAETIRSLASVPTSEDAAYLLVTHIRGRRKGILRRNGITDGDAPPQVFLDGRGRPITMKMAEAAFRRASKRLKLPEPIMPALLRHAILQAWKTSLQGNLDVFLLDLPTHYRH